MTPKMDIIWAYIDEHGPQTAQDIGVEFYPRQAGIPQMNGGPSRGTTCALWLLGRMERRGLLRKTLPNGPGCSTWRVVRL